MANLSPESDAAGRSASGVDQGGSSAGRRFVPYFVLILSLALTGAATVYLRASARRFDEARFASLFQEAKAQADHSLDRYAAVLQATGGLYAATADVVDRPAFEAYAAELHLQERYDGLQALGFAQRVLSADRAEFLAAARAESGRQFTIWPERSVPSVGAESVVIRYAVPPLATTRPAIGFDMASDPVRRAAMSHAGDAGVTVATPRLTLVRNASGQRYPGFIVYLPVYSQGDVPDSTADRHDQLRGFVFAAFRTAGLFDQLLDANLNGRLHLRVTDPASADEVLYDSAAAAADLGRSAPRHRGAFPAGIGDRTWTVEVTERPSFYAESGPTLAPFVLVGGIGISLVLFFVTRSQAVAHAEAQRSGDRARASQRALAASQSRLRRLVDANLIGVFFCDPTGEVSGGNDEFFRLLGQPRGGDGRPLRLADITPAEHRPAVERSLRRVTFDGRTGVAIGGTTPSSTAAFETAFVRPPGFDPSSVPVLLGVAGVASTDEADPIPGAEVVAFALDLTDRHRAERDLRQAKESAEAAQATAERANRSKDQFLAVLSHELRTPLTPVLATTAAAAADVDLPAAVRDEMAMIHRNVEMEARLIDDLLDLTRVGRGKLQLRPGTVDLHRVIADAVAVCPPDEIAAKRLTVTTQLRAGDHHVHGDAARLQQVFWNLVKNAIKFTPAGGRITVTAGNEPAGDGGRPWVVAAVADTGLGIEADVLPRVFEAFEQGSAARALASGGLGLGLAISRGLVDAHGGRIRADSGGAGQGATFTVRLRTVAAPAAVDGDGSPPLAAERRAPRGCRILLVEDHADTAKVLARLLGRSGHAVRVAPTRADALRLAAGDAFDLLVSDLGLPDGSGIDIVGPFREAQSAAGVACGAIALTGFGAEDDVQRARAAGFDEHLTKPVAFDQLEQAIGRVLATAAAAA